MAQGSKQSDGGDDLKVLFINPPSPYLENDASYPPSGLLYLAAVAEQAGHEASIMDLAGGRSLDTYLTGLADVIGISCVTPNLNIVNQLIDELPDVPIIVGGHHPTHRPMDIHKRAIVVRGEAEQLLPMILQDIRRGRAGECYSIAAPPPVSCIPKPARHLVDLKRYSPGGWKDSTVIYTSRGCPFTCAFCSQLRIRRFRPFPLERVIDEINDCISMGFKRFVFGDDNLIADERRLARFLTVLAPLDIEYRLNQDSRRLTPGLANLAASSGCVEISFGIESGSQPMLDRMIKRNTVENNEDTIRTAKRAGLTAKAYFMVNFPGETKETIKETLDFAERTRPDKWLLSNFCPLPGSTVYLNPRAFGITWMSEDWQDYYLIGKDGAFKPCFEAEGLSKEQQIENFYLMYDGLKERLG